MAIFKSPPKPTTDREQEVRRAEQEVAALENQQAAEMARLESRANEVQSKLQQLKSVAARAGLDASDDPASAGLQQRLAGAAVPPPGFDAHREQVLALRLEAARARMTAGEQVRQSLAAYDEELSRLVEQLAADEQLLRQHQARRDQEAARRAREAKQRADETARQARTELELPAAPPPSPTQPRKAPPPPPAPPEQPRSARVRMQASIDLQSESNFFQGFSTNLSEGGLFVATVQMLPRGTQVDLHFTLPGGKRIDARGVVRWTREANDRTPDIFPGVGVQFVDLSTDAVSAIRDFVSEREPLFFAD